MLRSMLRYGTRLALVLGFVAPPFLAYTWAVCPQTMRHLQLCPDTPLGVNCPASGGTQGCASYEWVFVEAGYFGCKSTKQNNQCVDDAQDAKCYEQGRCKKKMNTTNDCEQDDLNKQTFRRVLKVTEPCL